jgi:hypothetical protein
LICTSINPGDKIFPPRSIVRDGGSLEEKKEDWPEMIKPEEGEMNRSALIACFVQFTPYSLTG